MSLFCFRSMDYTKAAVPPEKSHVPVDDDFSIAS